MLIALVATDSLQAIASGLTDLDLVFIEEAFERLLLDYDRESSCNSPRFFSAPTFSR